MLPLRPLRAVLRQHALSASCRPLLPRSVHGSLTQAALRSRPNPISRPLRQTRLFSQTPRSPADPRHQIDQHYLQQQYHQSRLRTAKPLFTTEGAKRVAYSRGTKGVVIASFLAAVAFYWYNIQTVPVSGRRRFNCFPDYYVKEVSAEQVRRIIHEVESQGGRFLPAWDPRAKMVARVMKRLIPVSAMEGEEWELRVIDDPNTVNAFVLPGGKVFVHSGLLRVTKNEDGLAAVLGHEIAHNLAGHVGERMSSQIGPNILLGTLMCMSFMYPPAFLLVQYFGSGMMDVLFSLPMGRLQESEADYIGMMLMAEACFDPREAVALWQRMDWWAKRGQAEEVPEFLSTHPSNEHRIEKCREWVPKALEKWEASDCKGTASFANMFRQALDQGSMIVEF